MSRPFLKAFFCLLCFLVDEVSKLALTWVCDILTLRNSFMPKAEKHTPTLFVRSGDY